MTRIVEFFARMIRIVTKTPPMVRSAGANRILILRKDGGK